MRMLAALAVLVATTSAAAQPAAFSSQSPGTVAAGWQHTLLPKVERPTRFELVEDEGVTVLQATAESAASTLSHALAVELAATPMLAWRWKVSNALPGSDLRHKANDDYAARVYVFFDYDPARLPAGERLALALGRLLHGDALPAAALCYVWGTAQPVGTIAPNPYTDRLRMVVLQSGPERAGGWVSERRNLAADFEAAFGEPATRITGVALGADTDNTASRVVTLFGDLHFEALP